MAKVRKRSKWDRARDRRRRPRTPAAVLRARKETKLTLAVIKKKLDAFAEGDLEAWLRTGALPPLAAKALGIPAEPPRETEPGDQHSLDRWRAQVADVATD